MRRLRSSRPAAQLLEGGQELQIGEAAGREPQVQITPGPGRSPLLLDALRACGAGRCAQLLEIERPLVGGLAPAGGQVGGPARRRPAAGSAKRPGSTGPRAQQRHPLPGRGVLRGGSGRRRRSWSPAGPAGPDGRRRVSTSYSRPSSSSAPSAPISRWASRANHSWWSMPLSVVPGLREQEHQVEVRAVAGLARAEAAQRQHRQLGPGRAVALGQPAPPPGARPPPGRPRPGRSAGS